MEKDQRLWKILNSALELDAKKGHQKWTITELSRKANEARPLIYYYFGKSKEDILEAAIRIIGSEILGEADQNYSLPKRIERAVRSLRKLMLENPYLITLYFSHRYRDTRIGQILREWEGKYLAMMLTLFPGKTEQEIEALWCYLFGIVSAPSLFDNCRGMAVDILKRYVSRPKSPFGPKVPPQQRTPSHVKTVYIATK